MKGARKRSREREERKVLDVEHRHRGAPETVTLRDREGKVYTYCRCNHRTRFIGYSFGGLFQGISGFGIGEMGITSTIVSGIPAKIGVGTNHVVIAVAAIVASSIHLLGISAGEGTDIPWNILIMTIPAVIIGGQVAPYLAARLNTELMEKILIVIFAVLALSLLVIGLR